MSHEQLLAVTNARALHLICDNGLTFHQMNMASDGRNISRYHLVQRSIRTRPPYKRRRSPSETPAGIIGLHLGKFHVPLFTPIPPARFLRDENLEEHPVAPQTRLLRNVIPPPHHPYPLGYHVTPLRGGQTLPTSWYLWSGILAIPLPL